jgi:serine/threonine-protein kinase RsbW
MTRHEIVLQPDPAEIARLSEWIEQRCGADAVESEVVFKITLALEEAVMNVVSHAFDGVAPPHLVHVVLEVGPASVMAELTDNGHAFDPSAAPPPDMSRPVAERDPGGLGIHLMRTMMDRVEYRRDGSHNRLRLEKRRN